MEKVEITFPGGKRVDAKVGHHVVHTDQPLDAGGDDTAVAPFDLFLASLATCAGLYVLGFCQARSISTDASKCSSPWTSIPKPSFQRESVWR